MIDLTKPYERTDVEFEPADIANRWEPVNCKHCGEPTAHHWQTVDRKVWCIRNVEGKTGDAK